MMAAATATAVPAAAVRVRRGAATVFLVAPGGVVVATVGVAGGGLVVGETGTDRGVGVLVRGVTPIGRGMPVVRRRSAGELARGKFRVGSNDTQPDAATEIDLGPCNGHRRR